MSDTVGFAIAEVLRRNDTILVLNIERNDFREEGLIALAESLCEKSAIAA